MNGKDHENESIGIIAVIIIIVLAAIGLYFFFSSHRPPTAFNTDNSVSVPLEAPSPVHEEAGKG
ncbi:hypothetical protein [Legionella micdadei]|uniref:Uncharacterized protein n=1 Tax=Legionella micdadei TaxID=451 RepID=A0A098GJS4_LEGMI|nr:hypothetical protein [Legionella micdadei]ARG98649.1 hypothetical protein B6N58_13835 [Legionella micdadei]ARH01363.1 hypothetical protein B6V88_13690 [Legionella micdadei]KTD28856.1 hypothetical protein Lmic_0776 [Legionella micdadei]NSL17068.1 hypothetical protein [Legionella micdadei]CEG62235.1 conserved protein of unknown function [Legionella micdadei]